MHPFEPIDYQPSFGRLRPVPLSARNRSRWPLRLALTALVLLAVGTVILWASEQLP